MKGDSYKFTVDSASKRIDLLLVDYFEDIADSFSRNSIQELIKQGLVTVNGASVKPSRSLKPGDVVEIFIPEQAPLEIVPQDIPIRVVYEDDHVIVINKASDMVVHPAPGNEDGTLVNAVFHHCNGRLSSIGGPTRAGVVHRLDKDTSGLIVMAKSDIAHLDLAKQFAEKTAGRIYHAVVWGVPAQMSERLETFYGRHASDRKKFTSKLSDGKKAVTNYTVLSYKDDISLLRLKLETGRTHQIRVHMQDIGHPLLGDLAYGKKKARPVSIKRQALHASVLSFDHPVLKIRLSFMCPLESDFRELIRIEGL